MDDFKKPKDSEKQSVHHSAHHPYGDVNVTVHNNRPAIKTGVLERNWLTALLLAIFLGWFGIDQFYLGKTGKGILKLFTLGLFGILWLIDIIMIATKSVNNVVWKEGRPKVTGDNSTKQPREKKQWGEMDRKEKVGVIVVLAVMALIVFGIISAIAGGGNKTAKTNAAPSTTEQTTPTTTKSTPTSSTPATPAAPTVTVSQKNALGKAKDYLSYTAFSHDGLVDQLVYDKFSTADATYGADNSGANWNEQAAKKAKDYMSYSSFSRQELIDQLEYDKFTPKQATYGANSVGL